MNREREREGERLRFKDSLRSTSTGVHHPQFISNSYWWCTVSALDPSVRGKVGHPSVNTLTGVPVNYWDLPVLHTFLWVAVVMVPLCGKRTSGASTWSRRPRESRVIETQTLIRSCWVATYPVNSCLKTTPTEDDDYWEPLLSGSCSSHQSQARGWPRNSRLHNNNHVFVVTLSFIFASEYCGLVRFSWDLAVTQWGGYCSLAASVCGTRIHNKCCAS